MTCLLIVLEVLVMKAAATAYTYLTMMSYSTHVKPNKCSIKKSKYSLQEKLNRAYQRKTDFKAWSGNNGFLVVFSVMFC